MECIICQDSGVEPLQDNTACNCKYKRHTSCWIDYVHSTSKVKCLICRKDLSVKHIPKTTSSLTIPSRDSSSIPYSSQHILVSEETGHQITYQEFIDIVAQSNSDQPNTIVEVRPTVQQQQVTTKSISKSQKLLKIALCLGILAAIVVVIIIVL